MVSESDRRSRKHGLVQSRKKTSTFQVHKKAVEKSLFFMSRIDKIRITGRGIHFSYKGKLPPNTVADCLGKSWSLHFGDP